MVALGMAMGVAMALVGAASASHGNATVELFLLPHTHADVGWLETPVCFGVQSQMLLHRTGFCWF